MASRNEPHSKALIMCRAIALFCKHSREHGITERVLENWFEPEHVFPDPDVMKPLAEAIRCVAKIPDILKAPYSKMNGHPKEAAFCRIKASNKMILAPIGAFCGNMTKMFPNNCRNRGKF